MDDELQQEVLRLYQGQDSLSYYDFLGLRPGCDYVAVRDAFYVRAQQLHPDRFVALGKSDLTRQVYAVYKRVTEAFNVLSDPWLRVAYDEARLKGEHRLSDVARARRLRADERQLSNPFARIYLRSAQTKVERGELLAAWIDVRLGLSLEDAAPLRELHELIVSRPGVREQLGGDA